MQLWAVAMIKDEADIIAHTLRHLETEGVDGIIVADNMSTDGSREIVEALKLDCQLLCVTDPDPAYHQSRCISDLVQDAFACGADWVIPFDADEVWYQPNGTLRDAFAAITRTSTAHCARARLYNYYPTSNDSVTETNPYLRIRHRHPEPSTLRKVAVKRGSPVVIAHGNHEATRAGHFVTIESAIEIAHFPWRGWERFHRKIRNGYAALNLSDCDDETGAHWRLYGQLLEQRGPDALKDHYDVSFHDPPFDLEEMPAPWCRHRKV
jgi:glycosyltransferase involved in cell wall biosynthesis